MIFVLVYFRAMKRKLVICKSDGAFRFSRFLVPSQQRNHRKSFYCHEKYFAKENFRAPAWTLAKCYCGNKTGNPEWAVSLHLARSGSQSQRGIWFILPARGACHIINWIIIWQAPRAGSMRRILCSDWLPERARWSDTARPGLPVSFPQIKFRQSSSECTKVFFRKTFSVTVKRFSVIYLSGWN